MLWVGWRDPLPSCVERCCCSCYVVGGRRGLGGVLSGWMESREVEVGTEEVSGCGCMRKDVDR